jgi:hypothetical protein
MLTPAPLAPRHATYRLVIVLLLTVLAILFLVALASCGPADAATL